MSDLAWTGESLTDPHAATDKSRRVAAMFAGIAHRYDLANRIHTFGRDRAWRRATAQAAALHGGESVLDVACGTGEITVELLRAGAARVIGLDHTAEMLDEARRKYADRPIEWMLGDAMALPFADDEFDVVTIGFGLRNLPDTKTALRELCRVVRPGGRVVVLEFARPDHMFPARLYRFMASRILPLTGALITGDRGGAYRYLTASIETYLTFEQMRQAMLASGLVEVRSRRFRMAPVALHVGTIPSQVRP